MNLSGFYQSGQTGLFTRGRRIYINPHVNQSFYVPDGVTKIFAVAIGAGGGGACTRERNGETCTTGGEGGGYASGIISNLTPNSTITCTIGQGGRGASRYNNAAAGGNTSFGSYLTANGGDAGNTHSSYGSQFDYQTAEGGGGTASTSGVTDAHTASGGGKSPGYTDTNQMTGWRGGAGGGASSGSPWGAGTSKPQLGGQEAVGGAGWGSGLHRSTQCRGFLTSSNAPKYNASAGDGSHFQAQFFMGRRDNDNYMGRHNAGGNGLSARGGYSPTKYNQYNSPASNDNETITTGSNSDVNGENAAPNWWFPWDVDGGGGGSKQVPRNYSGTYEMSVKGGDGGPGAGGGAVWSVNASNDSYYRDHGWAAFGGRGGLGAGGGGVGATSDSNSDGPGPCAHNGGDGGFGGGGGAVYTFPQTKNGTNYTYNGGNGGNGIIIVYW